MFPRCLFVKPQAKTAQEDIGLTMKAKTTYLAAVLILSASCAATTLAQQTSSASAVDVKQEMARTTPSTSSVAVAPSEMTERERMLVERIEKLERRLAELESRGDARTVREPSPTASPASATSAQPLEEVAKRQSDKTPSPADQIGKEDRGVLDFFRDTTFNVTLDGYYGYNFNQPIGRINLLRAYDVLSNSFSLNQATIVIERAPNVEAGRRFGARLDLMYGQATEASQGSAANEGRPQAYRPIWQGFGTYVAPVGKGLTVDFGKFASSLGYETNYAKDDLNYSRSYFFNLLPFYHLGFRVKYPVNDKVTVMYHLMNGIQQSEDFNGFKSQHFALILTPTKQVSWQVNYYIGQEQRDVVPDLNPGVPSLPTQPGLSTNIIRPIPNGRIHIFDTYATWNVTDKMTLGAEADYLVSRVFDTSAPVHVTGGVGYARYQLTQKFALAGRAEYLSDRGGFFSGATQALKETTLTAEFKLAEGFLVRGEYRRDFSNLPFFLTDTQGVLKKEQNTATVGLIWWFGRKEGSW
jgi:putative OmpL-like beta-barrel porin-2